MKNLFVHTPNVHEVDPANWSKLQWRRWCVEQAIASRSHSAMIVQDAKELFDFIFPVATITAP